MKPPYRLLTSVLCLLTSAFCLPTFAQGTAFTYQGRLNDGASPATGIYDLRFTIYDSTNNPGTAISGPLTNAATAVSNGLFTVTLDSGAAAFPGADRWLEIGVRTNGGGTFTTLTPRQQLTPTPYAITAGNLTGTVSASGLSGAYSNAVTFSNAANNFSGSGAGLTALNAGQLTGGQVPSTVLSNAWKTTGNSGTTPGAQFIGTADNQPLEIKVNGGRALRLEPTPTDGLHAGIVNVVGGSFANVVGPGVYGATIAGGGASNWLGSTLINRVDTDFSSVGGGLGNTIQPIALHSTIAGGYQNTIQSYAFYSTIGGGYQNTNQTDATASTIGGGYQNAINAYESTIAGGANNTIQTNAYDSTIGGGGVNTIQTNATYSTIGGGSFNLIQPDASYSTIGGGDNNTIQTNAHHSTIGGGYFNTIQTSAYASMIGGGNTNSIQPNAYGSTISGGEQNTIQPNANRSTIGGGYFNTIQVNAIESTIGGGFDNTIQTNAIDSTIGGGTDNRIQTTATFSTIGGGEANTIRTGANHSTIGGGESNTIQTNVSDSTIGGGGGNTIQATAYSATIGGGFVNTIAAGSRYATVPGGDRNSATNRAFAAGTRARANHDGAFVWADSTDADFATTGTNQFLIRASGGVGINTNSPNGATLNVNGTVTALGFSGSGSGLTGVSPASGSADYVQNQSASDQSAGFRINGNGIFNGGKVGIGTAAPATALDVNKPNSATLTDFTMSVANHALGISSTLTLPSYLPGLVWYTTNNNPTRPKAGIWSQQTTSGSYLYLGTSDNYAQGITNQPLTIDFKGKVGIGTSAPQKMLHVVCTTNASDGVLFTTSRTNANETVSWTPGSASWSFTSDRNTKDRLAAVDGENVLEKLARVQIHEWSYIGFAQRHIGPMAQDFHAQFPLNGDDKSLNDADLHGVALAAIQGLNQKLTEELKQKETEITKLEQRLEKLEQRLNRNNGDAQ